MCRGNWYNDNDAGRRGAATPLQSLGIQCHSDIMLDHAVQQPVTLFSMLQRRIIHNLSTALLRMSQ